MDNFAINNTNQIATMRNYMTTLAALLIGALTTLPLRAQSGLTTEVYDFSTFTVKTLGLYNNNGAQANLSIGSTELFKVDGHSMYMIQDYVSDKGTFHFNGRFAMEDKDAFKLRSGQKVSGVNKYVGLQARTAGMHYLSMLNLAEGDKITIHSYDHNKVMQFISDNVKDYPPGSKMISGLATYTVTKAGNVDLKIEQYGYIYSIKIETSNPGGSTPSPSFKLTGTDGTKRMITISRGLSAGEKDVTTYYTTDGSTPTTYSRSFTGDEHTVTIGEGITSATKVRLKAMSVSAEGKESPVGTSQEYTVGTLLSLAPITISLTDFQTSAGGVYYPVYTLENDNSGVVGQPDVTFTATFNGQPIELTDNKFTISEPGILHAEATAPGYTSTQATVNVRQATWACTSATDFTAMTTADLNSADITTVSEWRKAIGDQSLYGYQIQHDLDQLAPNMKLTNTNWGLFFSDNALTDCKGVASRWGAGGMQFTLTDNQIALVHIGLGGVSQKAYSQQFGKGKNLAVEQYVIVEAFEIYEPQDVTNAIRLNGTPEARTVRCYTIGGQSVGKDDSTGVRIVTTTFDDGRRGSKKVIKK